MPETGSISGQLTNQFTFSDPSFPLLQNATVLLRYPVTRRTVIDANQAEVRPVEATDGTFSFENILPGQYILEVTAPFHNPMFQLVEVIAGQITELSTFSEYTALNASQADILAVVEHESDGSTEFDFSTSFDSNLGTEQVTATAEVTHQLQQTIVGIELTLDLENSLPSPITNFVYEYEIHDSEGNLIDVESGLYFDVYVPEDTIGTSVAGNGIGTLRLWFFPDILVPGDLYTISSRFSYDQDGVSRSVDMLDSVLEVFDAPSLDINVFGPQIIASDNPNTGGSIEAPQVYEVRYEITNNGLGDAQNLILSFGQPKLTANPDKLDLDFQILAFQIDDEPITQNTLSANFRNLKPGETTILTVYSTGSLIGALDFFSSSFVSTTLPDHEQLVNSANAYTLVHTVLETSKGADGEIDYLVDFAPDPEVVDFRLYTTDGATAQFAKVVEAGVGYLDSDISDGQATIEIFASGEQWLAQLTKLDVEGRQVSRILRADGTEVDRANFWQAPLASDPNGPDYLHLFDSQTDVLQYSLLLGSAPVPLAVPELILPSHFNPFGQLNFGDLFFEPDGDPLTITAIENFPYDWFQWTTSKDNSLNLIVNLSGAGFPLGKTTLTVTATDGEHSAKTSFDWTALDISIQQLTDEADTFATPDFHTSDIDALEGDDVLIGNAYSDRFGGGWGNDTLNGRGGDDYLNGGPGDDAMTGGTGDDIYVVDSLGDSITELAGEGTDKIITSVKINAALAGFANIEIFELAGTENTLLGNDADATLIANPNVGSKIFAFGGVDTLMGSAFNDRLDGGTGDDTLFGEDGRDRLDGGLGADDMFGGAGDDKYFIDDLGDTVTELDGEGADQVRSSVDWTLGDFVENLRLRGSADSGIGNDLDNVIQAVASGSFLDGGVGNDNLRGSQGMDTILGGDDNDTINGRSGDDDLQGGSGDDFIKGRSGEDHLQGGSGNDNLIGGKDNDLIEGGVDQDELKGEAGADTFKWSNGDFAGLTAGTADRITDFSQSDGDVIDLSAVDAIMGGADDAFTFIADAAFSGTAGELRFEQDGTNTMIYMDTDGDMVADYAIRLDGTINLAEADFVL